MKTAAAPDREVVWLVYDDECPVCRNYCQRVRLRDAVGELRLVDARQPGPLMDEITAAGLDIDRGMVVKIGDARYYGADAMHVLTMLSTRSGWVNRLGALLFSTRWGARIAYPVGRWMRDILLRLLGIGFIRNLEQAPPAAAAVDAVRPARP